MVEAVTFDFWNTTMWEPPGALRTRRLEVWAEALEGVDREALTAAHDAAHRAYEDAWRAARQYRVEDAATDIGRALGLPGDARQTLLDGYDEAGRRAGVQACDGIAETLDALRAAGVRLGIVCDIGLTPSPVVRELLDGAGLLERFDDTTFSDEVGHYKPAPEIFAHALGRLDAAPARSAHIGDRRRTDVAGAQAAGMRGVRYTAIYDDPEPGQPDGDAVIADLRDLPAALGL